MDFRQSRMRLVTSIALSDGVQVVHLYLDIQASRSRCLHMLNKSLGQINKNDKGWVVCWTDVKRGEKQNRLNQTGR